MVLSKERKDDRELTLEPKRWSLRDKEKQVLCIVDVRDGVTSRLVSRGTRFKV
jgi:hypothetical protein